nr:hypothetical protein [uncultured Acetatifactor sp.]
MTWQSGPRSRIRQPRQDAIKIGEVWNQTITNSIDLLTAMTGVSKENLLEQFQNEIPTFIEKLKSGDNDIVGVNELKKTMKTTHHMKKSRTMSDHVI